MKRLLETLAAWCRGAYGALQRAEEALDYHYEDYAQDRFARLEQRLAALEERLRE